MIEMSEMRSATETLARAFEEYKSVNDQRLHEIERKGSADVLHDDKLGRMDKSINNLQDAITSIKTSMRRPGKSGLQTADAPHDSAHKQAFLKYIAKGYENDLAPFQSKALEVINGGEGGLQRFGRDFHR